MARSKAFQAKFEGNEGKAKKVKIRSDTRHKMRLVIVCVLFTFENNTGYTDRRMDGRIDRRTDGSTDGRTDERT